jgi:cytochrome c oxidase subunit 3
MEIPYTVKPRPDTGLYNAKLGIWLFLASEVMLFGALFSSYVLLRVGAEPGTWSMGLMDLNVGAGNTVVLIASSMFVVLAWAELKQGNLAGYKKWKWATIACAVVFLCVKWSYEWPSKFKHYDVWLKDPNVLHDKFENGYQAPAFSKNQAMTAMLPSVRLGTAGHLRSPATSTLTRKPRSMLTSLDGRRTLACWRPMPTRPWPSTLRAMPPSCAEMVGCFCQRPTTIKPSGRSTRLAERASRWP